MPTVVSSCIFYNTCFDFRDLLTYGFDFDYAALTN